MKDGPICWIVWALKKGEARVGAICTVEDKADHYVEALAPIYPGFMMKKEKVPMDHAFGLRDGLQALVMGKLEYPTL